MRKFSQLSHVTVSALTAAGISGLVARGFAARVFATRSAAACGAAARRSIVLGRLFLSLLNVESLGALLLSLEGSLLYGR